MQGLTNVLVLALPQMMNKELIPAIDAESFASRIGAYVLVCAIFAGGLLVMLPNYQAYFFGNEHYYTDSALLMQETGDYLTPSFADGMPRFNKPVLTYWMTLAGFHVLGISVLASRIASLVAGIGVLILTGIFALRLFNSRATALTAMLILGSNIEFITASMRAAPDIFLCFSVLLSLYGFSGLLLDSRRTPRDAWYAYLGVGLAIASKGSLGLVLIAYAILFSLVLPNRKKNLSNLIHPVPTLIGVSLGLAWFAAVSLKHGNLALNGFITDQVGNRLSRSAGETAKNLFHYTLGLGVFFFPWSLLLIGGALYSWPDMKRFFTKHASTFVYMLGWYAILVLVFSPANLTRTRYLLPGFPVLALSAAALLASVNAKVAVDRMTRHTLRGLILVGILTGILMGFVAVLLESIRLGVASGAIILLAAALAGSLPRVGHELLPALLALDVFGSIWIFHFIVRPAFPSTPAYELVHDLQKARVQRVMFPIRNKTNADEDTFPYKDKYSGQLRMISGGNIVVERGLLSNALTLTPTIPVICIGDDKMMFPSNRYFAVRSGSMLKHGTKAVDIRHLLAASDKKTFYESLFTPCYIMFPSAKSLPLLPVSTTPALTHLPEQP